jgi:anaerobic magnesium-protoporphyrin IX monomethyl ester cyclase
LLINPSEMSVYRGTRFEFKKTEECVPPLNLAVVGAALRQGGHEVRILDLQVADDDDRAVEQAIREFHPELIGLGFKTPLYFEALRIAGRVRALAPETLIVGGGVHATSYPEECLAESEMDVICIGEADDSVVRVADGVPLDEIPDVAHKNRRTGEITVHRRQKRGGKTRFEGYLTAGDLDRLPFPAYDLYDLEEYAGISRLFYEEAPVGFMETSRGCLARCVFCTKGVFGITWRGKSPKRVVDEMEHLLDLGFREIEIVDDSFTTDGDRAIAICEEILKRGLRFPWCCRNGLRVANVSPEFFRIARRAGLHLVAFGLETGNRDVLIRMKKGATLERGREAVRWAKEAGITVMGYFMVALPGETERSMQDTIDFACSLPLDYAKFDITIPLPGTELYHVWKDRLKTTNWADYNFHNPARNLYDHPTLEWDTVDRYVRRAYRRFYSRPGYLLRQGARLLRQRRLGASTRVALQIIRGPTERPVGGADPLRPTRRLESGA